MKLLFLMLIFLFVLAIFVPHTAFAIEIIGQPENEVVGPNDWLRIFVKINGYSGGKIDWNLKKPDGSTESGFFENIQASKVTHTIVRNASDNQFGLWEIKYQYKNIVQTVNVEVTPLVVTVIPNKQTYVSGEVMEIEISTNYIESNSAKSEYLSVSIHDQFGKPAALHDEKLFRMHQPLMTQTFFIDEFLKYNTYGKYNLIVNYYGLEVITPFEIINPNTELFVFLSTDKSLYTPGDYVEINIGIPELTVDSGLLTVISPSEKIITKSVTTNTHLTKIILKDITADEIGTYTYKFKYSDSIVTKTFDVLAETLELPPTSNLTIDLMLEQTQYVPGQTINIIVTPSKFIQNDLIYWFEDYSGKKSNLFSFPNSSLGKVTISHTIPLDAASGLWKIYVKYGIVETSTSYEIIDESMNLTVKNSQNIIIPDWVRNNAKWWNQNTISDEDFAAGLEYMINKKIIILPEMKKYSGETEILIPSWIKNNAGWWSDGLISDQEFVAGIEYIVKIGIIRV